MDQLRAYINKLRHNFGKRTLEEKDAGLDPIELFSLWFHEAVDAELHDPNAMILSTASIGGLPSSRVVLLRNFNEKGFVFYTNYLSDKGQDLEENPHAGLLFFWPPHERQIRITGNVEKQDEKSSDDYFNSRPRESQIGAWTSEQSSRIASREDLEDTYKEMEAKFKGKNIPRPPYWGGFIVHPVTFEFWQGRPNRLHDRILFTHTGKGWVRDRLSP